jgi:hypothetical protein
MRRILIRVAWWAIAAMAIAWPATTPCRAGTFDFVNYPTLQSGANGGTYTITGTITTNGNPLVTTSSILSWSLTATDPVPGNPPLTLSSADPGAFANVFFQGGLGSPFEDASGIFLPTGPGGQSRINLGRTGFSYNFGSFGIPGTGPGHWATQGESTATMFWIGFMDTTGNVQYASTPIPEPASLTLALLAGTAIGVVGFCLAIRRRRAAAAA